MRDDLISIFSIRILMEIVGGKIIFCLHESNLGFFPPEYFFGKKLQGTSQAALGLRKNIFRVFPKRVSSQQLLITTWSFQVLWELFAKSNSVPRWLQSAFSYMWQFLKECGVLWYILDLQQQEIGKRKEWREEFFRVSVWNVLWYEEERRRKRKKITKFHCLVWSSLNSQRQDNVAIFTVWILFLWMDSPVCSPSKYEIKQSSYSFFSVLHVWERGMSVVWRGKNSHFKSGVEGSIVECEFYCTAAGHISQTSSQTCRRGT